MAINVDTGGFFQGGAANQRNINRQMSLNEDRFDFQKQQSERAAQQRTVEQRQKQFDFLLDGIRQIRSTFGNNEYVQVHSELLRNSFTGAEDQALGLADINSKRIDMMLNEPTLEDQSAATGRGEAAAFEARTKALGINRSQALTAEGLTPAPKGLNPTNFFNPKTGDFETVDINTSTGIERGRELITSGYIKTGANVTGGASDFGLTAPETRNLNEAEISTRNAVSEIDRVVDMVSDSDSVIGLVGGATQLIEATASQIQQASIQAGDMDEEGILDISNYTDELTKFGDAAANSAKIQSGLVALAYTMAKANNDRVSDADVRNELKALGANSGSKKILIETLTESKRRAISRYKNRHIVAKSRDPNTPEFPSDFEGVLEGKGTNQGDSGFSIINIRDE